MITGPTLALRIWNLSSDPYSSQELAGNFSKIEDHDHTPGRGKPIGTSAISDGSITRPKMAFDTMNPIDSSVTTVKLAESSVTTTKIVDSNVTPGKLSGSLVTALGVNDAVTRRGKAIIATEESRTNTGYGLMPTPDQVTVSLPTDGLIFIAYQGMWKSSVAGAGKAAIFIGSNQLRMQSSSVLGVTTTPAVQEVGLSAASSDDKYVPMATTSGGLALAHNNAASAVSDVTTGQIVGLIGHVSYTPMSNVGGTDVISFGIGGPCFVFASAGTYAVSVQHKSTSGSVTVKERKLWVWTVGF